MEYTRGCEHPQEACGVVGVYAPGSDVARVAFFGLYALQHRGQESAGIATADGTGIRIHTAMGLVGQAFHERDLEHLTGHIAIGHTRYSTTGSNRPQNAQPVLVKGPEIELALGHNGNVVNAAPLRKTLEEWGAGFSASTDSEVIAQMLAWAPGRGWQERLAYAMRQLQGAYSLVILTKDTLLGCRDPLGVRPLCLGRLGEGGWVMASESCALDHVGAQYLREVEPGETVLIDQSGLTSIPPAVDTSRRALCVFEHIYFARPDSVLDGKLVHQARQAMGAQLAREHPVEADIVIGVPDSATAAAVGYARASSIPYAEGLIKNRYVGRTFIQPDQRLRDLGVQMKFNPLPEVLWGKRVVVVDDSIVRGTTTPHVVNLLRRAGALEVHLRVCAPPIRHPCPLGVDMATMRELIAAGRTVEEVRQFIGADSLGYLSVKGLHRAVGGSSQGFCNACFTGNYPIPVQLELDKLALEVEEPSTTQPTHIPGR
ncbi:MAG: amidophosphoribosyltransferase [Chloroflexi bacterium]|nr:amidophosphoribosyltransferase [Chloroflexota bacterium]